MKKIAIFIILTTISLNIMAQQKIVQTAGRTQLVSLPRSSPTSTTTSSLEKYGAAKNSWFAHLAFEIPGENSSNEWLEPVTDEEYDKLK